MRHTLKEAGLQNPVLTNRNGIRGYKVRINKHPDIEFVKFCLAKLTKLIIGTAGIGGRKKLLPGEICN